MKANELMIGDWVYNTHNDQPEQVYEIGSGLVMLDYNDLYEYDEIEPIMLTEAILKANGFTSEVVVETIHFVSEDRRLILQNDTKYLNSNREWYIHIDSVAMSSIGSAEFTYVHELQHILRLFGFDKEIILNS